MFGLPLAQAASDVAKYKALSLANTQDLIASCSNDGMSDACRTKIADLVKFTEEAADLFYQPENDHASPYIFAPGGTFNLDNFLAPYLKDALANNTSASAALEAGLTDYARQAGTVSAVLDVLGVAGVAACSSVSVGACAVLAIGAAASANHLYGSAQQAVTGQEANTALVAALVASGKSEVDAEELQNYLDAGIVVVTVVTVGGQAVYRYAVNAARLSAGDETIAALNGKGFNANGTGPGSTNNSMGSIASEKVTWVDEVATMSPRARAYDEGALGSRSNIETQKGQAPALSRTTSDGQTAIVRFDGADGDTLIDRKLSVVTTPKAKDQVLRQSEALLQNGLAGRWEVPNQSQADRAINVRRTGGHKYNCKGGGGMTESLTKVLSKCIVDVLFQIESAGEGQLNSDFAMAVMEAVGAELQGLDSGDTMAFIAAINEIGEVGISDRRRQFIEDFPDNFGLRS